MRVRRLTDCWCDGSLVGVQPIRRVLLIVGFLSAPSGCATQSAARPELDDLKAEVRALRAENGRLERRLDRLELQRAAVAPSASREPRASPGAPGELPPL